MAHDKHSYSKRERWGTARKDWTKARSKSRQQKLQFHACYLGLMMESSRCQTGLLDIHSPPALLPTVHVASLLGRLYSIYAVSSTDVQSCYLHHSGVSSVTWASPPQLLRHLARTLTLPHTEWPQRLSGTVLQDSTMPLNSTSFMLQNQNHTDNAAKF